MPRSTVQEKQGGESNKLTISAAQDGRGKRCVRQEGKEPSLRLPKEAFMGSVLRKAALQSFVISIVLTLIAYFNGGVRYSFAAGSAPPIVVQLIVLFILYFVISFLILAFFGVVEQRRKKK